MNILKYFLSFLHNNNQVFNFLGEVSVKCVYCKWHIAEAFNEKVALFNWSQLLGKINKNT